MTSAIEPRVARGRPAQREHRDAGDRARIASLIRQSDYTRRSPASAGGRIGHKEWSHFCVLSDAVDLLVNFSLMDSVRPGQRHRTEVPRLTLLARDERWYGAVDRFETEEVQAPGGRIDLDLGANRLRFAQRRYEIDVASRSNEVAAKLCFEPLAMPALTTSIGLSSGRFMKWLVVPRMRASGEITVDGRTHCVEHAPAYHDHDWGYFDWGDDFAWEWGLVLPRDAASPWSLVYMRISDRGRLRVLSQGVLLWKHDAHARTFRGRDLRVGQRGFLRTAGALRIPRVMSLVSPGTSADVPREMTIVAEADRDHLALDVSLLDLAQIGIPNDLGDRGVTLLSEARGSAHVEGRVRGERVCFDGPAIVEFNHAGN